MKQKSEFKNTNQYRAYLYERAYSMMLDSQKPKRTPFWRFPRGLRLQAFKKQLAALFSGRSRAAREELRLKAAATYRLADELGGLTHQPDNVTPETAQLMGQLLRDAVKKRGTDTEGVGSGLISDGAPLRRDKRSGRPFEADH